MDKYNSSYRKTISDIYWNSTEMYEYEASQAFDNLEWNNLSLHRKGLASSADETP